MNKEILQSYNERLANNNTSLNNIIETSNNLITIDGVLEITENGTYDVQQYAEAKVDCSKSLYTPRYFSASGSFTELDYEMANIDVVNATSLGYAFNNMSSLTRLDLNHWNTSNITNLSSVFNGCTALETLNISNWDTSNVTSMYGAFYNCSSLTTLDLSNWETSNVTAMAQMFYNCKNLKHLDIRKFTLSHLTTTAKYNNMLYNVPTDCEIIVGYDSTKSWFKSKFGSYSNVKTVAEYEAAL